MSFRNEDGLAPFPFSTHLFFHRFLNGFRRNDVLYFYTVNLNAPRIGCFIQNTPHTGIDNIATCQRTVKFQLTDNISERSCRQVFNRIHRVFNAVGIELRIGNLKIDNRVDHHGNVVLCNNRLGLKVEHSFLERHLIRDPVDKRHLNVQTDLP